jgi:hypothetical protein
MKKAMAGGIVFLAGIALGLSIGLTFKRYPISGRTSVVHYCSCIEDQPEYQSRILHASSKVNAQIENKTKEFAENHQISGNDFHAQFVPLGNGNYEMVFWCSNRTRKIGDLYEAFLKTIEPCLEPHTKVLDQAHEAQVSRPDQSSQSGGR